MLTLDFLNVMLSFRFSTVAVCCPSSSVVALSTCVLAERGRSRQKRRSYGRGFHRSDMNLHFRTRSGRASPPRKASPASEPVGLLRQVTPPARHRAKLPAHFRSQVWIVRETIRLGGLLVVVPIEIHTLFHHSRMARRPGHILSRHVRGQAPTRLFGLSGIDMVTF